MSHKHQKRPGHQGKTQGESGQRPNRGSGTKTQGTWVTTNDEAQAGGEGRGAEIEEGRRGRGGGTVSSGKWEGGARAMVGWIG